MVVLRRVALIGALTLVAACTASLQAGSSSGSNPTGDVEPSPSGKPADTDPPNDDGGVTTPDATDPKPEPPGDLLGTLSGPCGLLKTELTTKTPSLEQNALVFTAGETYEKASLSSGGQTILETPNAGGSSEESEVMSFEVLHACEGATLIKTETEIKYSNDDAGPASITDILVEIDGKKVGVSVTRAYKPQGIPFPDSDVKTLLEKKLVGINRSSQRVMPADKWVKQILHVFASNKAQADAVVRVLPTIDAQTRADTIVVLTQTTGGGFVYCNPDPPLGSECP